MNEYLCKVSTLTLSKYKLLFWMWLTLWQHYILHINLSYQISSVWFVDKNWTLAETCPIRCTWRNYQSEWITSCANYTIKLLILYSVWINSFINTFFLLLFYIISVSTHRMTSFPKMPWIKTDNRQQKQVSWFKKQTKKVET